MLCCCVTISNLRVSNQAQADFERFFRRDLISVWSPAERWNSGGHWIEVFRYFQEKKNLKVFSLGLDSDPSFVQPFEWRKEHQRVAIRLQKMIKIYVHIRCQPLDSLLWWLWSKIRGLLFTKKERATWTWAIKNWRCEFSWNLALEEGEVNSFKA